MLRTHRFHYGFPYPPNEERHGGPEGKQWNNGSPNKAIVVAYLCYTRRARRVSAPVHVRPSQTPIAYTLHRPRHHGRRRNEARRHQRQEGREDGEEGGGEAGPTSDAPARNQGELGTHRPRGVDDGAEIYPSGA